MEQKVAKIQNALKTEYADFANFCKLSDKQFVHELTMSDFIAFRTQYGVTRDYVAGIQRLLADYDPAEEQLRTVMECPAIDSVSSPDTSTDKLKEQYPSATRFTDASERIELNEEGMSLTDSKQFISKESAAQERKTDQLDNLDSSDSTQSIYIVFGIQEDPSFAKQNINTLDLSKRALNCLNRNHCHTLDALFSKRVDEIVAFKNLGKKTLSEIIEACKAFSVQPVNPAQGNDELPPLADCKTEFKSIAESIARGLDYDISALTVQEQEYAKKLEEASEILGHELCKLVVDSPIQAGVLYSMLRDFVNRQGAYEECKAIFKCLKKHRMSEKLHVLPFAKMIYNKCFNLGKVFDETDRFIDIAGKVDSYLEMNPQDKSALEYSLYLLRKKLEVNINDRLLSAYEHAGLNERNEKVLQLRQSCFRK